MEHEVQLSPGEMHHLARVLRVREGETVVVFDGCGRSAPARFSLLRNGRLWLSRPPQMAPLPPAKRVLLQALCGPERMDWLIEKATELDVSTIVPLLTKRCMDRKGVAANPRRVQRWQRLALAACRQSCRDWMPIIEPVTPYAEALGRHANDLGLFLVGTLNERASWIGTTLGALTTAPRSVGLLIGPEGGLTEVEMEAAIRSGARPVRLARGVLRTETAAVAGLAMVAEALERMSRAASEEAGKV